MVKVADDNEIHSSKYYWGVFFKLLKECSIIRIGLFILFFDLLRRFVANDTQHWEHFYWQRKLDKDFPMKYPL